MKLGVVGYGHRIRKVISKIEQADSSFGVTAITDLRNHEIKQELRQGTSVDFYEIPEDMIAAADLDAILIGTLDDSHADLTARVLDSKLPVFLETPVATNGENIHRLKKAYDRCGHKKVCVSSTLRSSSIAQFAKEIVDSGKIGSIEHIQAWNNVHFGANFYQNRSRAAHITGGLFLQKAAQDFSYINLMVNDLTPVQICAMTSQQVFGGNKPSNLTCKVCDEKYTCNDSKAHQGSGNVPCIYSEDIEDEDSGTAIWRYDTGMHAVYSQNFVVRRKAGKRGARFIGYKGTLEIDFYESTVKVYMHHTPRVETYDINPENENDHAGSDDVLAQNFVDVVKGKAEPIASLDSGLLSALIGIKAHISAKENIFQTIEW